MDDNELNNLGTDVNESSPIKDQVKIIAFNTKNNVMEKRRPGRPKNDQNNQGSKESSETKVKKNEVYKLIAKAMIGDKFISEIFPPFQSKYVVIKSQTQEKLIYEKLDNDLLMPIRNHELIGDEILNYSSEGLAFEPAYLLNHREAMECLKVWRAFAKPITNDVAIVRWKGEPGLCFNRLPWTMSECLYQPTPLWDEILSRIHKNKDAFTDFIASLMFEESYQQEYLWLHGRGGDGKGAVFYVLSKVFGEYFNAAKMPGRGQEIDRYLAHYYQARVLAFDDVNQSEFSAVTQGWFKSLTGGAKQTIKPNYKQAMTIDFKGKIIISANGSPEINNVSSEMRRIIYIYINPREEKSESPTYYQDLWNESGAFLAKCILGFLTRNPTKREKIITDIDTLDDVIQTAELFHRDLFDSNFQLETNSFLPSVDMTNFLTTRFKHRSEILDWLRWLDNSFGLKIKNHKLTAHEKGIFNTSQKKGIRGLKFLPRPGFHV